MTNPTFSGASPADVPSASARPHIARALIVVQVLALTVALAAGCGSETPAASTGQQGPPPSTAVAATTTTPPGPTIDAVLAVLAPAGATAPDITTEDSDPNNQLGRPGQYTARATFVLPGGKPAVERTSTDRGGSIEIWPAAEAAQKRSEYIQGLLGAGGSMLGTEYHYLSGPVLVRVVGTVKPSDAKKVEDAVKGLPR